MYSSDANKEHCRSSPVSKVALPLFTIEIGIPSIVILNKFFTSQILLSFASI